MLKMFYIFKLALTFGLFFLMLTSLIRNIDYYSYCKLSQNKTEQFSKKENSKEFRDLCNEVFKDFSDHIFLKYSFTLVYEVIKPERVFQTMGEEEANLIIKRIEQTYLGSLKYNLQFFKLTNFLFYIVNLYIIFIVLPEFLTRLIIFILDKCLFILFLFFVVEGFLNFYTNIKINTISIISTFTGYLPMWLIKYAFKYAWNIISNLKNFLSFHK